MKRFLNNKGFTLLEILVTVGIVGVLSAVAVPAYNQYKKGTIETAVESDVGNFQKAYMAYNAVHGDYCASFAGAGIKVRDGRNYAKGGAIGFGNVNAACGGSPDDEDVQVIPESGTCSAAGCTTKATCETAGTCNSSTAGTWTGNVPATIGNGCELDIDQFRMGATTNVSGIEKVWGINEEGKIKDAETAVANPNSVNCPTGNWDDNTVLMTR